MDELKRQAALAALDEIRDGMVVGLGTGSTASHFIRELGRRVRDGLRVVAIPTSEASQTLAVECGITLTTFRAHPKIDVTVDGADEVSPALDLIKGLGGALVREKVVAHASERVVIVVDESKLVEQLGQRAPVPVEVAPFAADVVAKRLEDWGGIAPVREKDGKQFVSDNGNIILDWRHGVIDQPSDFEKRIKGITGVLDSGIFADVADLVIVAGESAIRKLTRKPA